MLCMLVDQERAMVIRCPDGSRIYVEARGGGRGGRKRLYVAAPTRYRVDRSPILDQASIRAIQEKRDVRPD